MKFVEFTFRIINTHFSVESHFRGFSNITLFYKSEYTFLEETSTRIVQRCAIWHLGREGKKKKKREREGESETV